MRPNIYKYMYGRMDAKNIVADCVRINIWGI